MKRMPARGRAAEANGRAIPPADGPYALRSVHESVNLFRLIQRSQAEFHVQRLAYLDVAMNHFITL